MENVTRIISGGQTGADRAALDFAIARGIPYGGWCPKGGWAEDVLKPPGLLALYPDLSETPDTDPRQRTDWNVRDADITLVLATSRDLNASRGTAFTIACAQERAKPFLIIDPHNDDAAECIRKWLEDHPGVLNIAGPRESEAPGIYAAVRSLLEECCG